MKSNITLWLYSGGQSGIQKKISSELQKESLIRSRIQQTKKAKKYIPTQNEKISKIYIPPSAKKTLTAIKKINKNSVFPIIIDKRLSGPNYNGDNKYNANKINAVDNNLEIGQWLKWTFNNNLDIRFGKNGESQREFLYRILDFLLSIKSEKGPILAVTHQTVASIIEELFKKTYPANLIGAKKELKEISKITIDNKFFNHTRKKINDLSTKGNFVKYKLYNKRKKVVALTKFIPNFGKYETRLPTTAPLTFPFLNNRVMLTLDKNSWWNPLGGHVEKGESWEDTLVREAVEEAGVKIDKIVPIGFIKTKIISRNEPNTYPVLSQMPIAISTVKAIKNKWKPRETLQRKLCSINKALDLLKTRADNEQIWQVFSFALFCKKYFYDKRI